VLATPETRLTSYRKPPLLFRPPVRSPHRRQRLGGRGQHGNLIESVYENGMDAPVPLLSSAPNEEQPCVARLSPQNFDIQKSTFNNLSVVTSPTFPLSHFHTFLPTKNSRAQLGLLPTKNQAQRTSPAKPGFETTRTTNCPPPFNTPNLLPTKNKARRTKNSRA